MRLVLVSDGPIPKGPWELLWLVQAHRTVFGWVKLAPIKYEKFFVQCHMKSDEELFWKSTKFTTTTPVDWEKTGTRTSVSAGKRKLKMQSVGRWTTTTTLNVNTNVKLWCSFATKFFARLWNNARSYYLSRTSSFIDDEEFFVLSDVFEWKNTCFSYKDYSTCNLNEIRVIQVRVSVTV